MPDCQRYSVGYQRSSVMLVDEGVVFKTIALGSETEIALGKKNGIYFLRSRRGDLEMKLSLTEQAMIAVVRLYAQIEVEKN